MALQLRMCIALAEDESLVPRTQKVALHYLELQLQGILCFLLTFVGMCMHILYREIDR